MTHPGENEVDVRRSRLTYARLALADAQRRLAENRMIMAALHRGLQEAQDRLDAISAAEAAQKQRIHGEP